VDKGKSDVKYHPVEGKTYNLNPDDKPLGQFKVLKVVVTPPTACRPWQ